MTGQLRESRLALTLGALDQRLGLLNAEKVKPELMRASHALVYHT